MDTDEQLSTYARMLRASPHNLMSARGLEELETRHFPESDALAGLLPRVDGPAQRVLDVGSGGGLPGIVIAIRRPDVHVELLEARSKKVRFLESVLPALGLECEVHHGRAEDLIRTPLAESFDVVTARALAPLRRLLGWTIPFLRPGGLLYAVKGERWRDEVVDAQEELVRWSASIVATPGEVSRVDAAVQLVVMRRDPAGRDNTEGHVTT